MNRAAIGQIFFDECHTLPAKQTARRLLEVRPALRSRGTALMDVMATAYLIALPKALWSRRCRTRQLR